MSEVFLQIDFLLGKGRHEAFTDRGVLEPLDDFGDDRRLQRPERYMLNRQSLAFLPLILHGIEREDVVVVLNAFAGLLLLRHKVVEQMRRDSQDFVLPDTIVDEFVVKTLGDQSEHLVALLFERRFFILLFAHIRPGWSVTVHPFGIFSSPNVSPSRLRRVASTLGTNICVSAGRRAAIASKVRAFSCLRRLSTRVS